MVSLQPGIMKKNVTFLAIILLASCNSKNKNSTGIQALRDTTEEVVKSVDTVSKKQLISADDKSYRTSSLTGDFKQFKIYGLADTIRADLTGDNINEEVIFTALNNKKGIIITDGKTRSKTKIGLGKNFGGIGDNFEWVDFWGTTDDKETYDIIVDEKGDLGTERKVKLKNTSLFVRRDEVGVCVIAYIDDKYKFIHQSD